MITYEQYRLNKQRLGKAEIILDEMENNGEWQSEKYKKYVETYSKILEDNLEFEYYNKIGWAANLPDKKQEPMQNGNP